MGEMVLDHLITKHLACHVLLHARIAIVCSPAHWCVQAPRGMSGGGGVPLWPPNLLRTMMVPRFAGSRFWGGGYPCYHSTALMHITGDCDLSILAPPIKLAMSESSSTWRTAKAYDGFRL